MSDIRTSKETDTNETVIYVSDLNKMMPSYHYDLIETVIFIRDGWVNFYVKYIDQLVNFDQYVEHMLNFTTLILDKKFKCDDNSYFLNTLLCEINITEAIDQSLFCDSLIKEITSLYDIKSMNRKKFMIYFRNFLDEIMKNHDILLEENGLVNFES